MNIMEESNVAGTSTGLTQTKGESTDRVRTPRGYPKGIFTTGTNIQKFLCGICLVVLMNPVQTECGHRFCEECLLAYVQTTPPCHCPRCREEGEDEPIGQSNPDFAIRREMGRLATKCLYERCEWTGKFRDYIQHENTCDFKPLICPYGCDTYDSSSHKQENVTVHLLSVLNHVLELQKRTGMTQNNKRQLDNLRGKKISEQEGALQNLTTKLNEIGNQAKDNSETSESQQKVTDLNKKQKQVEGILAVLNQELEQLIIGHLALEHEKRLQEDLMKTLETRYEKLTRSLALKEVQLADQDQRLDTLQHTTYDGTMVWPITGFRAKQEQAIHGQTTSIYSPCFYTSRNGYKMCLRLYLNGDGMGKATHISVFFVLKRSQYDAILSFPFRNKVVLKLLNQANKSDIVEAFRPDPTSNSFRKPVSDMNIGSGCPLFCPLDKMEPREGFLKDDTIFIKAIIVQE